MVTAIPQFCFPEASGSHSNVSRKRETFSFTLTKSDATKAYGYCRRFLAGDTPVCYCIVSQLYAPSLSLLLRRHGWARVIACFARSSQRQRAPMRLHGLAGFAALQQFGVGAGRGVGGG